MISDTIKSESLADKKKRMADILNKGVDRVYRCQLEVMESGNLIRSGVLERALRAGQREIRIGDDLDFSLQVNIPIHARFLDMKRYGDHHIYNPIVFGILYGSVRRSVRKVVYDDVSALRQAIENSASAFVSETEKTHNTNYG